jgi:hypothetical protein
MVGAASSVVVGKTFRYIIFSPEAVSEMTRRTISSRFVLTATRDFTVVSLRIREQV